MRPGCALPASSVRRIHGEQDEGEALLQVDGQPPRTVKAGESFVIPAGVVHDAHNEGSVPTRLIGVYVVEKGKPLASPAP